MRNSNNRIENNCLSFLPAPYKTNSDCLLERLKNSNPDKEKPLYDFSCKIKRILISNLNSNIMTYRDYCKFRAGCIQLPNEALNMASITIIKLLKSSPEELLEELEIIKPNYILDTKNVKETIINGKRTIKTEYIPVEIEPSLNFEIIRQTYSKYSCCISRISESLINKDMVTKENINILKEDIQSEYGNDTKDFIASMIEKHFGYLNNEQLCFYDFYKAMKKNAYKMCFGRVIQIYEGIRRNEDIHKNIEINEIITEKTIKAYQKSKRRI